MDIWLKYKKHPSKINLNLNCKNFNFQVIPDFWDAPTISALRARALEIVNENGT